jgi:hypothetical protein
MSRFLDDLKNACQGLMSTQNHVPVQHYVLYGDKSVLEKAKQLVRMDRWELGWMRPLLVKLGAPSEHSEEARRAMEAAVYLGAASYVGEWLQRQIENDPADDDACLDAYLAAFGSGQHARMHAAAAIIGQRGNWLQRDDGKPNAVGRFLLSLSNAELASAGKEAKWRRDALTFLLRHASDRVPAFVDGFLRQSNALSDDCCMLLLELDRNRYHSLAVAALENATQDYAKVAVLCALAEYFPDQHTEEARTLALGVLRDNVATEAVNPVVENAAFAWLLRRYGANVLPELDDFFSKKRVCKSLLDSLDLMGKDLGPAAAPAFVAALKHPYDLVRRKALSHLIDCRRQEYDAIIGALLAEGLRSDDAPHLCEHIELAGRSGIASLAERLWELAGHKVNYVRKFACKALESMSGSVEADARSLLTTAGPEIRATAAKVLATATTSSTVAELEARLDQESDELVRDEILRALDRTWQAQGRKFSREDIQARIVRTADKLRSRPAPWIDEKKLPLLTYVDSGKTLDPLSIRYLFYRQSRARDMRPDVECKPLYALIDRKTSGDFALTLLRMYLGRKEISGGRWAMAIAGILGDDRVVPVLVQQIRTWVAGNHVVLAQSATEALAVLGSDASLCAVDAIALRYRTKKKVAKAASEALVSAADSQGITVDELGDRIVPWLEFVPGKPLLIEHKDKRIEVRIGLDFHLAFRDVIKGKKIASLPASIPAEVKRQYKDLADALREVAKAQVPRIENLMVRQFHWTSHRWKSLFLVHPVLFPFAVRLIWGIYDSRGQLLATFRALEDCTLTNEHDECVELHNDESEDTTIGVVHPLELSSPQRLAWSTHLGDYKIVAPFTQLERRIVSPRESERTIRISTNYQKSEVNGMAFRSRLDRMGWQRGPVGDGGMVAYYRKKYLGGAVDAIIELDGMPILGMDAHAVIALGRFYFTKAGTVGDSGSAYDVPRDDKDPRLLSFGEVPPIVFSETLGDLARIAVTKREEEES